ncbi:hypothetical protein BDZ97DRAFT_1823223 [Flammula alnicola]|nr:hypothetical protein BDZ97DRAFT_1823223 [Flammula alnicola]
MLLISAFGPIFHMYTPTLNNVEVLALTICLCLVMRCPNGSQLFLAFLRIIMILYRTKHAVLVLRWWQ